MLSEEEVLRLRGELEARRALKKKYRRRQIIIYIFVAVVALVLMLLAALYSYRQGIIGDQFLARPGERLLVLFLGTDQNLDSSIRADTIILVSLDAQSGEASLISIPRDTRVWVESRQRWDRVNATYAHGGADMTMRAISQLLQVPISYYVHTDFQGFEEMVDVLGGVEMDVAKEMHYVDKAGGLTIHIKPGRQILDGNKALQYVRYRDRLGDVALVDPFKEQYDGRVERQRQFLEALAAEVLSPASLLKLPRLVSQTFKIVDTNLPWEEALGLALVASRFSPDRIRSAILPGNSEIIGDAWYWLVDDKKAQAVVDSLIWGKQEPLRLVVLNGNGRAGIAQEVATLLHDFGYDVVSHGNAEHFNFLETKILVSARDAERVQALAKYLDAVVETSETDDSEVVVVLGKNFDYQKRSVGI